MSMSNTSETDFLKLIFNATTWANYAINATASPETNIVVGLHSADPGEAGTMATSEVAYTSYARVNVLRTTGGWTVTGGSVSPVADISFPSGTGGGESATYFSAGKSGGGAAAILVSGAISPPITTGSGITPRLTTSTVVTID
jgi:hypothetical protein